MTNFGSILPEKSKRYSSAGKNLPAFTTMIFLLEKRNISRRPIENGHQETVLKKVDRHNYSNLTGRILMEEPFHAGYVELEPFIHQVGGHSFMLSLDGATVCKPLVEREHLFYQKIPNEVQKFLPHYYGIISVKIIQTEDDYVRFIALPPSNYVPLFNGNKHKIRLRRSGSIEIAQSNHDERFQEDQHEGAVSNNSDLTGLNPWVLKCHRENLCSLLKNFEEGGNKTKEFIVLENLTWKFTYPCILDLKMGTRQYGDAATLAKKQSKMYKVVSTTSAKLGLRVGGMQVYQIPSKHYLCRNKFYGRTLSVNGFQQALIQFLHNGARFRSDVLPVLIRRLEELSAVLGRQETVRLYTTSLLLLYEGDDYEPESTSALKSPDPEKILKQDSIRKINIPVDSEVLRKTSSAESLTSYDEVVMSKSVPSLRRRSSTANFDTKSLPSENSSNGSSDSMIFEDCCDGVKRNSKTLTETLARTLSNKSDSSGSSEPNVDVKMIDFAHSTHKALDDPVVYTGPDRGFLFGLEKLISILKSIESDYG